MNFSGKIRVFCAAFLLALGLTGAASAAGVPEDGVLAFDIVRNGEAIGTHTYRFDRSGGRTEVRIKTDINFRLFFIPVYRFEHESKEVWQDGRLDSLESNTNENGTPVKLQVHRDEDSLMVYGEDGNLHVDREIIPASLWNRLVLDRSPDSDHDFRQREEIRSRVCRRDRIGGPRSESHDPALSADR